MCGVRRWRVAGAVPLLVALALCTVVLAPPAGAAGPWNVVAPGAGAQYGRLASVSCATLVSCIAVGVADTPNMTTRLTERWNGTKWVAVATPNPANATSSQFTSVHCRTATSCVAVGQYSTADLRTKTLIERWNGTAWSIVASPNPVGIAVSGLASVHCTSATFCVAVGSYYMSSPDSSAEKTLVEHWNGTTWKIVASPNRPGVTDNGLSGVSCTSATSCFAVGHTRSELVTRTLVERWNGTTWSIVASPNPASVEQSELIGVTCRSATSCFAVGSGRGTLVERWNGTTWSIVPSPSPAGANGASLTNISCPTATRCVAVGDFFKASSVQRLLEEWNGTAWSIVATAAPAGTIRSSFSGVACATGSNCFAVGEYRLGPSRRPLIDWSS